MAQDTVVTWISNTEDVRLGPENKLEWDSEWQAWEGYPQCDLKFMCAQVLTCSNETSPRCAFLVHGQAFLIQGRIEGGEWVEEKKLPHKEQK